MNVARLRSAAALLTTFLFAAVAGESIVWHDHPLGTRELAPYGYSQVEHEGEFEAAVHFDRGELVRRPGCWACILASSPTEAAAPPAILVGALVVQGIAELDSIPLPPSPRLRPAVARGPPLLPLPQTA